MNSISTQHVPAASFKTRVRNDALGGSNPFEWMELTSNDIFQGRRIVLFALPGAFTPTCSSTHLPGYETSYDAFTALGVDEVYCLSVNDAFVMYQWAKHLQVERVKMLPDGSGEFTRKMGMLVNKDNLGFGPRSWRYAMVVDNGEIQQMFIEPGLEDNSPLDPFEVSYADTVLAWLRATQGFEHCATPSAAMR